MKQQALQESMEDKFHSILRDIRIDKFKESAAA